MSRKRGEVAATDLDASTSRLTGPVKPLVPESADPREVKLRRLRGHLKDAAELAGFDLSELSRRLGDRLGRRPRLLDLFCGGGGAGQGYHLAGFDVTGVDIEDRPSYPFQFIKGDALKVSLKGYDAVHASPPCQRYSRTRTIRREIPDSRYQDLLDAARRRLTDWGGVWVIENVATAPMGARREGTAHHCILLCGTQFGLKCYRHRLFESNEMLFAPPHYPHRKRTVTRKDDILADPDAMLMPAGHFPCYDRHAAAMGIDWGMTRDELAEAIPPAFTRYLGGQLVNILLTKGQR